MNSNREQIINKLLDKKELTRHIIDSYHDFVENKVEEILSKYNNYVLLEDFEEDSLVEYVLTLNKVKFVKDTRKKIESHSYFIDHQLTYEIGCYATVGLQKRVAGSSESENYLKNTNILLFKLPILIGSKFDDITLPEWDVSGYFIMKGVERYVINLEELINNKIIARRVVEAGVSKVESKFISEDDTYKFLHKIDLTEIPSFNFMPINVDFNLITFLKVLDLSDQEIIENVCQNNKNLLVEMIKYLNFFRASDPEGQLKALKVKIARSEESEERFVNTIQRYLLPHLNNPEDTFEEAKKKKGHFLLMMLRKGLLLIQKKIPSDKIDNTIYKKVNCVGRLLKDLLANSFSASVKNAILLLTKQKLKGKVFKIDSLFKNDLVSNKISASITNGNWLNKNGVTSALERNNPLNTMDALRKVIIPSVSKQKQTADIRLINISQRGRYCAPNTPHSYAVGIVKNLALGSQITRFVKGDVSNILKNHQLLLPKGTYSVFLDERLIGYSDDLVKLNQSLKDLRSTFELPLYVNFNIEKNEVYQTRFCLRSSQGRLTRLFFTVRKGVCLIDELSSSELDSLRITELLEKNYLTALDYEEEINSKIGLEDLSADYLNLHPLSEFSLAGSQLIYLNHNSSSRSSIALKTFKQAVSKYLVKKEQRPYSKFFRARYVEKPLIGTRFKYPLFEKAGQNVMIAMVDHEGFNSIDAIVANKQSVELGLFNVDLLRSYEREFLLHTEDVILNPTGQEDFRDQKKFVHLNEKGLITEGEKIKGEVCLIGCRGLSKYSLAFSVDEVNNKSVDKSIYSKKNTDGFVETLKLNHINDVDVIANVIINEPKSLKIGDKLSNRHGQKGVIGKVERVENLPYTPEGLTFDLLITPYGVASRRTAGHLLELLAGFAKINTGENLDATSFSGDGYSKIVSLLKAKGFEDLGLQTLINPQTGEPKLAKVFSGTMYYERLHHLVDEKIHARSTGKLQIVTGQPPEGRANQGGLRVGEMERDCFASYGAARVIKDRMLTDLIVQPIDVEHQKFIDLSNKKKNESEVAYIKIPYIFRVLISQLRSLGIGIDPVIQEAEDE